MLQMGWIGCGRHASQMLLPQLGRNDIRIAAVCDVDESAARRVAAQYGVDAVFTDYADLLAHQGAERLESVGQPFDPNLHEAVGQLAGAPAGTVLEEVEPGYRLEGELIRAAKVFVANGEPS